jgi:hypothetical protein
MSSALPLIATTERTSRIGGASVRKPTKSVTSESLPLDLHEVMDLGWIVTFESEAGRSRR